MLKQLDDFASIECLDWVNYMLTNNQILFIDACANKTNNKKKQIYYVRKKAEIDKIIILALKDNRGNN